MERTRSNGNKFQQEVERYLAKEESHAFQVRLRTPQAKFANVNNISDYIIFARRAVILEVKETSLASFSLNTIQQKEELVKFQNFYNQAMKFYAAELPYRAIVLVHFIKASKYTSYFIDTSPLKVIHPDDIDCITTNTLKETMENILW